MHCITWPKEAADWPVRYREFGWPDATTIDDIVSIGCDLVHVSHRQYRQGEWPGIPQWRLSFSKAETILLNSWTPTQQTVYHVVRFVFNRENLGDFTAIENNNKILSKYHIKTLMMWVSEMKHSKWWMQNNIVQLSSLLIKYFAGCCQTRSYRSYFTLSNLFECEEDCSELTIVANRLKYFTDITYMTEWLVTNYVGACIQLYPESVQRLFDGISTDNTLQSAMNAVIERKHSRLSGLEELFLDLVVADIYSSTVNNTRPRSLLVKTMADVLLRDGWRCFAGLYSAYLLGKKATIVCYDLISYRTVLIPTLYLVTTLGEYVKLTTKIPSSKYFKEMLLFLCNRV